MSYFAYRPFVIGTVIALGLWPGCTAEAAELDRATRAVVETHLAWADAECRRAIDRSLRPVDELIARAKRNTPSLAADLLGFSSKWAYLWDRLPLGEGDRHVQYVRARMAEHMFTPEQLRQTIERSVRDYLKRAEDIENQALVRMRVDLEDLPRAALAGSVASTTLRRVLDRTLAEVRRRVAEDLRRDVGTLVASEVAQRIAGRVLRSVAFRLGISGGLITAGAASSWTTLGTSLAAGWAMDWAVLEIWDWWADPVGDLAAVLSRELDRIRSLLIHGEKDRQGLHDILTRFAAIQAARRRAAVLEALDNLED